MEPLGKLLVSGVFALLGLGLNCGYCQTETKATQTETKPAPIPQPRIVRTGSSSGFWKLNKRKGKYVWKEHSSIHPVHYGSFHHHR